MSNLSLIPPELLMIHDLRSHYMCKIREIEDFKIRVSYEKLCKNKGLKVEHKQVDQKGLRHALKFPKVFKVEWIKIILS